MADVDPARNTTYTLLENEGKGRARTGHNVIHGTKKYKNKNGKLFYGISGKKNAITYMSDILSILKDCPYIIKQHGEININNNTHTLFIPDAGNQDLLEWSNKLVEERIKLKNNSTQLGKNAVSKHIQNTTKIIWKIVQQIAAAIQCMHSKKIKHLDIKCENIVVDDNDNIVLIDWENAQIEDPCILHKDSMTAHYLPLNMIHKIKNPSNKFIMFNGYYHDIYAFTCILFLIIITNLLSEPYIISCIKIIKYILSTINIHIDTWLSTQVFYNLMSGWPIKANTITNNRNIKKNPWYKYIKDQYDKSNYNSATDNDASSIIEMLKDSLELSKHDFSKNVNENWLAREASFANHNDSWLANEQPSQLPANQPGGARFRKKHTRRKYRHSRKSFSRTKKH